MTTKFRRSAQTAFPISNTARARSSMISMKRARENSLGSVLSWCSASNATRFFSSR